jgi:outer membrane protein assembly factor BamA
LPKDKHILKENRLKITEQHSKATAAELRKLYKQRPNGKLLFVFNTKPYHYIKGTQGKNNLYKRFQRNVLGEPPVLADTLFMETTVRSMRSYLRTQGYFYSSVDYDVNTNRKNKAIVSYNVHLNKLYKFGEITIQAEDADIYELLTMNMGESRIKQWMPYNQNQLLEEQDRLVNLIRNNGYYLMSKEFIDFDIDTSTAIEYCYIGVNIRNINDTLSHQKYYNGDITVDIETNPSLYDTEKRENIQTAKFSYNPNGYRLNPEVLEKNILLSKDQVTKLTTINRTYGRLSDLEIFRFVNIQSQPYRRLDSNFINYTIRLIPEVKYGLTFEPQATLSDQNNTFNNQDFRNYGVAFITQFTNRNIFQNAENFTLNFRSAFEAQGQTRGSIGFFNSTEQKLTASLVMPRTLLLSKFDKNENFYSNKTILSVSGIYEINIDYSRRVLTLGYNNQLNKKLISYFVWPIEVSYINSRIVSSELQKQSENDIFLQNLFANNLIVSSRMGFVFSNRAIKKNNRFVYLKWDLVELAGTPLTLINKLIDRNTSPDGNHYTLFGVRYSEFFKSSIDVRYNLELDVNNTLAFRAFGGYALPFGNFPDFVPFEKRYFVGGANDLRGWRPRAIGPGSFASAGQIDFSGEVKLEANVEYRLNIYKRWLEGAIFIDAGNVWNAKPLPNRVGGEFNYTRFINEIAISPGIGIRFNFDIFLVRFDFATPIHDPKLPIGTRWQTNDLSFYWISKNTNFNFGIGYPF